MGDIKDLSGAITLCRYAYHCWYRTDDEDDVDNLTFRPTISERVIDFYKIDNDEFRLNTCKYVCDNYELVASVLPDTCDEKLYDECQLINDFITNLTQDEFVTLFNNKPVLDSSGLSHLSEKCNQLKQTPTYYIVTRDKENIKKFVEVVVAMNVYLK